MNSIIFDMDGVIFDTELLMFDCWRSIASDYELPNIETVYPLCIGTDERTTMQLFQRSYGNHFPLDEIRQKVVSLFCEKVEKNGPPIKSHVVSLLEQLKVNNWKIALASGTYTNQVQRELSLAGLIDFFDVVVGGDMVKNGKPAPDIFHFACQKLDCVPRETFVIEDSENGIRAAYSAGTVPIMVPDLIQPSIEIKEKCFRICSNLKEVSELLL